MLRCMHDHACLHSTEDMYGCQQQRIADRCVRCNCAGEDAFTLQNAALFIDDYLGAYPNGICLSSFVSCPSYYGYWGRGGW